MNQVNSETLPDEPILFRPMLESLEPRRLLSAAMTEPVIAIAEFSFGASGGSSSMTVVPVHVDYQQFASPPLGARRIVESFSSGFGDRGFSVTFFVTPWSVQNSSTSPGTTTQTPSTPTYETKETPSNSSKGAKESASEQITTLAIDSASEATRSLPTVQHDVNPSTFATSVVENVDATPRATDVKHASDKASHLSTSSPLELLQREDELVESRASVQPSRPWYQVLDRDVIRQENRASEANTQSHAQSEIVTRGADQAESLRTLALRMAKEQNLVHVVQPVTASVESTPISIWQRIAMVTLTGGALVANWYVRRRRAKFALSGFEKTKAGRNPYLP